MKAAQPAGLRAENEESARTTPAPTALQGMNPAVIAAAGGCLGAALLFPIVMSGGGGGPDPASAIAIVEIPPNTLGWYIEAASSCQGLPWQIVAAIGWSESRHARGETPAAPDHQVSPPIVGPDTGLKPPDDHAVGPMQFLPSSWAMFGVDANNNGEADPQEIPDAIYAAVRHLCPNGTITDLDTAINAYSGRMDGYLDAIYAKASEYGWLGQLTLSPTGQPGAIVGAGWALPTPASAVQKPSQLREKHHDYPAWDFMIPTGTPIYAIRAGEVVSVHRFNANWWASGCSTQGANGCSTCGVGLTIRDDLGTRTTYCHGSALYVDNGDQVTAGQQILDSGNTGRSGGPHLHLEIRINGTRHCPQPLLVALYEHGAGIDPHTLPTSGCSFKP